MSRIKWKIRNILKDGRILQLSEGLPVTEASLEAFREYGEIALKATSKKETPAAMEPIFL